MEIVAMDMKVSGMYIARQLSFSGVSFRIEEIGLDSDFKLVYNKAAKLVGLSFFVKQKNKQTNKHDIANDESTHKSKILLKR